MTTVGYTVVIHEGLHLPYDETRLVMTLGDSQYFATEPKFGTYSPLWEQSFETLPSVTPKLVLTLRVATRGPCFNNEICRGTLILDGHRASTWIKMESPKESGGMIRASIRPSNPRGTTVRLPRELGNLRRELADMHRNLSGDLPVWRSPLDEHTIGALPMSTSTAREEEVMQGQIEALEAHKYEVSAASQERATSQQAEMDALRRELEGIRNQRKDIELALLHADRGRPGLQGSYVRDPRDRLYWCPAEQHPASVARGTIRTSESLHHTNSSPGYSRT
eukprot:NODE_2838_length_1108_cov_60.213409_g2602_i0.p1 GENE.NODE_2838_length_1108_cov_60.213409_g2602_i0~~NODE_2838_length_1108_cov_60.213409_g2602_i0.p1  ORF type:complete len:318 (+),score=48.82 NODE_2838_length_1108_cov_60.213409_g2602_i0:118-954(+)